MKKDHNVLVSSNGLKQLCDENRELKNENLALQKLVEDAETALSNAIENYAKRCLNIATDDMIVEIDGKGRRVGQLVAEVSTLRKLVSEKDRKINELQSQAPSYRTEGYQYQIKKLSTQLQLSKGELSHAEFEIAHLKSQLAESKFEIAHLKDRLESKKSTKTNIWDNIELIDFHEKNNYETLILRKCSNEYGDFIDARLFNQGNPTQKGLCLNYDLFKTFISMGQRTLSKIKKGDL